MPTIQQLPAAQSVDAADLLAVSQSGTLRAIASGELLATTQPAIMAPTGALLGRLSLGPGGPEPVGVGPGLEIQGSMIAANGGDHAAFPVEAALAASDQFVISSAGQPKLLPLASLKSELSLSALPVVTTLAAGDLVAVSQNGTDAAISLANLLNGETIDEAAPAAAASDSDTVWVAQGGSVMLRQSFGAIWSWAAGKLPSYKLPVLEISADTTLDGSVHNGRLIICSKPLTLTPAFPNMGSGFSCDILNVSGGEVVFGPGIVSSGQDSIGTYQFATVRALTYSGGNLVFAAVTGTGPGAAPGQVGNLAASAITDSGAALNWTAPGSGGTVGSYLVQYEVSGTSPWLSVTVPGETTSCTLTGLSADSAYVATVTASNSSGAGQASATLGFTTLPAASPPGAVTAITWNLAPSPQYTAGSGSIGVNVHVSPSTAPVQFGLSSSSTIAPVAWTAASLVNSDLWGVYVPVPSTTGTYYLWCEGTDGSAPTVYPTAITVD